MKFSSLPWERNAYSPMCLGEEGKFVCCFHIPVLVWMKGKKQIFMEPFSCAKMCNNIFCTPLDSYHSWWLSISKTGSRLTHMTNYTPPCPHLGLVLHLQPYWNSGVEGVISAPNRNQFGFGEIFCIIQEGESNNCTLKADEECEKLWKPGSYEEAGYHWLPDSKFFTSSLPPAQQITNTSHS